MTILTENQRNIGAQKANTAKSFTTKLSNTSAHPVTGLQIDSFGCGACTSGSLSAAQIAAGGTAILTIVYKPSFTGVNVPRTLTLSYSLNGEKHKEVFTFLATSTN